MSKTFYILLLQIVVMLVLLINNKVLGQCNQINDFNNGWYAQGGNWDILGAGNIVHQTVNGADVYFLNGSQLINTSISGSIRTDDNDDDQMGFVFGVQGTIGVGNFHYYLFQWDEGGNGNGMYIREIDQNGVTTLFSDPGNYWVRHFNHNFIIDYFATGFSVTIDGTLVHTENASMSPGEFGFYNRSQADVTYSNLIYTGIFDYTLVRDSICQATNVQAFLEPGFYDLSTVSWDMGDGTVYNNLESVSHNYNAPGEYNITCVGTDLNGCVGTVTKSVQVLPQPTASFQYVNTCTGDQADFFNSSMVLSSDVIETYEWSIGTETSNNEDVTLTFNNNGVYTVRLEVETVFGCVDDSVNTITIYESPTSNFMVTDGCLNEFVDVTNSSTSAEGVITANMWSFGDASPVTLVQSLEETPQYEYFQPGVYDVRLIVETEYGCRDTAFQTTERFAVPVASFYASNACVYDSVQIESTALINSPGVISSITWDYGDGNTSTNYEENHKYNAVGTYSITLLVESSDGCIAQDNQNVEVYPAPISSFQTNTVCDNEGATLFQNSSSISSGAIMISNWSFGDNSNESVTNPSHQYALPGIYSAELISISDNGCVDTLVNPVTVKASPIASFSLNRLSGCSPLCVDFLDQTQVNSSSLVSQEWFFDNNRLGIGSTFSNCFENNSNEEDVTIDMKYIVTNDVGCEDTLLLEDYLTVYHNPIADFSIIPPVTNMYEREIKTINNSIGTDGYLWFLTDTDISEEFEPVYEYPDTGKFEVLLIAYTQNNCVDSLYQSLLIEPVENIYVPNAFSPNGDGANDVFNVASFGIKENGFLLQIYNRWGEVIFETDDLFEGWNGTEKGEPCEADVYVYSVTYVDLSDVISKFRGTVALIR
ncbi:MAG: PKD domain-containing protein [Flavobacteriales bacterium]|jgi:gliding motility-associated-like protein|nr:PKD domain-containing protein [Flavobacteriales bacterium]